MPRKSHSIKLSVSVPLDQWQQAEVLFPYEGPSSLVQLALRALIDSCRIQEGDSFQ